MTVNDGPRAGYVNDTEHLDGNALAGMFSEVFAADLTSAVGRCANCGASGALATTHLYHRAPGMTLRCAGCGAVLMRMCEIGERMVLDLRGLSYLSIAKP